MDMVVEMVRDTDDVCVDETDADAVDVIVDDRLALAVVVPEEVAVLNPDIEFVVDTVDVIVELGVVLSQFRKPPSKRASISSLRYAAISLHSVSIVYKLPSKG